MNERQIILASSSPRRIEMMKANGYEPIILPADIEENLPLNKGPKETVMFLALSKAMAVEERVLGKPFEGKEVSSIDGFYEKPIIIAADTIVYDDVLGIIGKPHDKDEAFEMLKALSGKSHIVVTGVAILEAGSFKREVFAEVTEVFFKEYGDEEIEAYIDTDEPYDKAGGYAIQGTWGKYVDRYDGDLNNVIGFPMDRVAKELKKF